MDHNRLQSTIIAYDYVVYLFKFVLEDCLKEDNLGLKLLLEESNL